jgi:2-polyprenyl-6-methoxyphenol hydroxylase-like FAD-dependent oxidoreductase
MPQLNHLDPKTGGVIENRYQSDARGICRRAVSVPTIPAPRRLLRQQTKDDNVIRSPHTAPRVLIVGAGPTGLALAIELGHRSIPCLVIERNARVGHAPRAKTTNVRTREHLRRWGIAGKLRAASPLGVDYPSNVLFVTRLAGYELARFENAMYCAPGKNPMYAEHAQWVPQYTVEEVLREHAASLPGVEIRFNCELMGFEQGDAVSARVRDLATGQDSVVVADFLVGADGARSVVRDAIGAKMEGTYGLSRNYNVVFRAPGLDKAHRHGPAIMYWQVNDEVPSLVGPMDKGDRWFFMPTAVPENFKFHAADAAPLIRRATGIDLPYEILSSDEWVASKLLANRYRQGRVFLAGDACHLHPPFGGYGMNMGIADGVDLGWKLAAVLQGWGGGTLLDSYEAERRPVHQFVLDEATANHSTLSNQLGQNGLEDDSAAGQQARAEIGARVMATKLREFNTLGVVKGYRYVASPIIASEEGPESQADFLNYVPSARPGGIAPHAWLHDGRSLYDTFGAGFTLLVTDGSRDPDVERFQAAAVASDIPLTLSHAPKSAVETLYRARYALIRPDQHVAWRGDSLPSDAMALLKRVSGQGVQ